MRILAYSGIRRRELGSGAAGAKNIEGPKVYEEPNYCAVFFKDPEGNKLEAGFRK